MIRSIIKQHNVNKELTRIAEHLGSGGFNGEEKDEIEHNIWDCNHKNKINYIKTIIEALNTRVEKISQDRSGEELDFQEQEEAYEQTADIMMNIWHYTPPGSSIKNRDIHHDQCQQAYTATCDLAKNLAKAEKEHGTNHATTILGNIRFRDLIQHGSEDATKPIIETYGEINTPHALAHLGRIVEHAYDPETVNHAVKTLKTAAVITNESGTEERKSAYEGLKNILLGCNIAWDGEEELIDWIAEQKQPEAANALTSYIIEKDHKYGGINPAFKALTTFDESTMTKAFGQFIEKHPDFEHIDYIKEQLENVKDSITKDHAAKILTKIEETQNGTVAALEKALDLETFVDTSQAPALSKTIVNLTGKLCTPGNSGEDYGAVKALFDKVANESALAPQELKDNLLNQFRGEIEITAHLEDTEYDLQTAEDDAQKAQHAHNNLFGSEEITADMSNG